MAKIGEAVLELRTDSSTFHADLTKVEARAEGLNTRFRAAGQTLQSFGGAAEKTGAHLAGVGERAMGSGLRIKDLGSSLSNTAGVMSGLAATASVFARGNEDLQKRLQATSMALAAMSAGVRTLGAALRLITRGPIGIIITAIGALVAAVIALAKNWDAALQTAARLWKSFADFLGNLWSAIATTGRGLGEIIAGAFTFDVDRIKEGWAQMQVGLGQLKDVAVGLAIGVKGLLLAGWDKLSGLFDTSTKSAKTLKDEVAQLDAGLIAMLTHMGQALGGAASEAERVAGLLGRSTPRSAAAAAAVLAKVREEGLRELELLTESASALGGHAAINYLMEFGGKLVEQGKIMGHDLADALKPFTDAVGEDVPAEIAETWKTTFGDLVGHLTAFAEEGISVAEGMAQSMGPEAAIVFLQGWRVSLEAVGQLTKEAAERINAALIALFDQLDQEAAEAAKKLRDSARALQDAFSTAFSNIVRGTESFADAMRKILDSVLDQILRQIGGAIFSFIFPSGINFTKRQHGGPLEAFQPARVGEAGVELFVPSVAGTVIPHDQLAGGGGMQVFIDARGSQRGVSAEIRRAIDEMGERAIRTSVVKMADESMRGARFRR